MSLSGSVARVGAVRGTTDLAQRVESSRYRGERVESSRFISVETTHFGSISWWWTDDKLHDYEYKLRVNDAVNAAVAKAKANYDVTKNLQLRCQFEGVELMGSDIADVTKAANDVASVLKRFKGVVPLA